MCALVTDHVRTPAGHCDVMALPCPPGQTGVQTVERRRRVLDDRDGAKRVRRTRSRGDRQRQCTSPVPSGRKEMQRLVGSSPQPFEPGTSVPCVIDQE